MSKRCKRCKAAKCEGLISLIRLTPLAPLMPLAGLGGGRLFEGFEGGVPAEGGAFDAGGEGVDSGEGGEVAQLFGGLSAGDDVFEIVEEGLGFGGGFAFDLGRHEGRGGLRDGAAGTFEADGVNAVGGVEVEIDGAVVAAARVVTGGDAVGGRGLAAVAGAFVVVEDDRLVEIGEIGHWEGMTNDQCPMTNEAQTRRMVLRERRRTKGGRAAEFVTY